MSLDVTETSPATVEEFNLQLRRSGWETHFRQLDLGARQVALTALQRPHLSILKVSLPNRTQQQGSTPPNSLTFGIPARPQAPIRSGAQIVPSDSITCFADSVDVISESDFSAFTLTIDTQALECALRATVLTDARLSNFFSSESRAPSPIRMADMRRTLDALLLNTHSAVLAEPVRQRLLENFTIQLPAAIVDLWQEGQPQVGTDNIGRERKVIRRALDYLTSDRLRDCRIEDVCHVAACSQRSLERAFRRYFQITPKQYINRLRLSAVHRCLLKAESNGSVGEAAAAWGFWHLSQFAASYQRMFGELPSETVRKAARRAH